jgi:hypothetical protein
MTHRTITHRGITITTLTAEQDVAVQCTPGHMAIREQTDGWWLYFVDEMGGVSGYDSPFASYKEALWSAKAAAEFAAE